MWTTKKNSLNFQLLKYFLAFSFLIIAILWLFQFIFFNSFYREQKMNDIKVVANKISQVQITKDMQDTLNEYAFNKSVCIEIANKNYDLLYSSTYFGKGCISGIERTYQYKFDFINSNKQEKSYYLTNHKDNTETLVYAIKLQNNQYAFINSSLQPIDSIVTLIKKQLIVITILLVIISIILSYVFSNHLSKPIKEINKQSKNLAKGKFDIEFEENNILEIQELSNTLNYVKEELNKTEEYRRDLMANVSHDLKTPLTMIKAYAEIAKDLHKEDKDKQEEDMNTIISETDRLTVLVNDILELSKMEAIQDSLNNESFDLILLITDILSKYKVLQETERYQFEFIHKDKDIIIEADKKRMEQVIYNLMNNAINYTGEDNKVTIKVTTTKKEITVEIKDTGKGIKESDIPYIWDKYYKNKKKHKRNLIGTGLGLSIVKKILENHHYEYGVYSKKEKGTTFYFKIPKKED